MTLRFKGYMSSDISKCQKIHFSSFPFHSIVNQTRRYVIMDISMMSFFYYKHDMQQHDFKDKKEKKSTL